MASGGSSTTAVTNAVHHDAGQEAGLSRLLHRRANRPHARDSSVGSLDRVFDTGKQSSRRPSRDDRRIPIQEDVEFSTYGVTELRDNFFDAVFLPPEQVDLDSLMRHAEQTLPYAFRKRHPLSIRHFLPKQWHELQGVWARVTRTRAGIKLSKSFLAFFISFVLCLVPAVRQFLGRYNYIMPISSIINHSGRSLGAQADGLVFTVLGTATGLGWGSFGLWLSTVTASAQVGYGAILALFFCLYMFLIACMRSYYIRTYQFVISTGIAITYACLAEVSSTGISWPKLLAYALPWIYGQAVALLPCLLIAPDAGARPLAVALHSAFEVILDGMTITRPEGRRTHRKLAQIFVNLSQAYRDLIIDFSITYFDPKDVLQLRNLMQAVVRTLLSLKTETRLFDNWDFQGQDPLASSSQPKDFVVTVEPESSQTISWKEQEVLKYIADNLAEPTKDLLAAMRRSARSADAVLMQMCGHRKYLGPPPDVSDNVAGALVKLRKRTMAFGNIQDSVLSSDKLPSNYADFPEVVKLFAFCRPVHQAASAVEALLVKVNEMQQRKPKYPKLHLPTYPFWKSLYRSNAQVRHDRGGVTAGAYFRSFGDIDELIQKIKSRDFQPLPRDGSEQLEGHETKDAAMTATDLEDDSGERKSRSGHRIWKVLHRLQGFETRFGLKTALVTSLLALPAWLSDSNSWWDEYEIWWAVVAAWLLTGPRVGGNVQDLFARAICAVLGSVWGCLSYVAGNGSPYVTAVFALVFMLPMMYRFTQSTHPRSGLVGCISFTVVSLAEHTTGGQPSRVTVAATRGGAITVGVVAAVVVNWILWPFVARHDLRKGISSMLFYSSIVYRSIVSKYVYYEVGDDPTKDDITASEILEGRLREGFVRLRQLLGLTRHELRLRAPFDPLPFSALIDACERFFEYLITVRQSSLFYHPHFIRDNPEAAARLLQYRRDAIAAILTNLYVLAGALRAGRKVPKYLPNAQAARQELLKQMKMVQTELEALGQVTSTEKSEGRRWAQIYSYSYNESLTGCVDQLRELEKYTKAIVGEQGFEEGVLVQEVP